jgi:hypothetical protein
MLGGLALAALAPEEQAVLAAEPTAPIGCWYASNAKRWLEAPRSGMEGLGNGRRRYHEGTDRSDEVDDLVRCAWHNLCQSRRSNGPSRDTLASF